MNSERQTMSTGRPSSYFVNKRRSAHNKRLIQQIESNLGGSSIETLVTTRQIRVLDMDAANWDTALLDKILDLAKIVMHAYVSASEAATVDQYIKLARDWMENFERVTTVPLGERDVQSAIQHCIDELVVRYKMAVKEDTEMGHKIVADYRVLVERQRATLEILGVLRTSIDDNSPEFEDTWEVMEDEIKKRNADLSPGLKSWLHEKFTDLWEFSDPLPPRQYSFTSRGHRGRQKGAEPELSVTWELPPGGRYDSISGNITYKSLLDYDEVYGAADTSSSVMIRPYTNAIEVEHLSTRLINVKLNGELGRMAIEEDGS
jgi:hypothetical protein